MSARNPEILRRFDTPSRREIVFDSEAKCPRFYLSVMKQTVNRDCKLLTRLRNAHHHRLDFKLLY
jgi:hypothetical protein